MANRTVKEAGSIKGTNPQYLIEKIIRTRIYESIFWKEQCFGLSSEFIVDKGMELRYFGGIYAGNIKPTPFLCLTLKLLQLQPEKDIIIEFIRQEDFKYLRALGALYIRLVFNSIEVYKYLEPLYNDYRKLRCMDRMGKFSIMHMDEFIDHLLREERYCDVQLPRLQKRQALEETDQLDLYSSALHEDLDNLSSDEEETIVKKEKPRLVSRRRSRSRGRSQSRERSRERRKRSRTPDKDQHKDRSSRREEKSHREHRSSRRRKDDKDDKKREIEEANAVRASLGLAPLEH